MTEFEVGKDYVTRDGSKARIYATDGAEPYPIHGAFLAPKDGGWVDCTWTRSGNLVVGGSRSTTDLMRPAPREWWIVGGCGVWDNERQARHSAGRSEVVHVREVMDDD